LTQALQVSRSSQARWRRSFAKSIKCYPTTTGSTTIADRLRARARQLGLSGTSIAELAGVKRSFFYDILSGRSERPGLDRLEKIAAVLKVEATWLLNGTGEVEGESSLVKNPDLALVAIPCVDVR
jgi:hypothetical protein